MEHECCHENCLLHLSGFHPYFRQDYLQLQSPHDKLSDTLQQNSLRIHAHAIYSNISRL